MSKFYVGQRVRAASVRGRRATEATVIGYTDAFGPDIPPYEIDCDDSPGEYFTAFEWQLSPLTPPPQLADWDSDEMPCDRNGKYRQPVAA